ncbi:hypothetical protein P4O66_002411 [Electrophorus voltai]|uniref:Reverse transcriptase domain-containing protein n=1 Tax=Electrophorus voltai TaxID=2609070 RepID=A0AAD8Z006_9TELE|nr:hypothetical protein P4O66_002411 [Electrophorus voltai]
MPEEETPQAMCKEAEAGEASWVLEFAIIGRRPFYLPREFTSVFIIALYIPPSATTREALQELYGAISELQSVHPDGLFIVAGYFNHANLKSVLPKFHQHVNFATREQTCWISFTQTSPVGTRRSPAPTSDTLITSVMLIPAYRPIVRRSKPFLKQGTWPAGAISALQDCFEQRTWITFKEAATDGGTVNLEEYTALVTGYISKCIDDVIVSKTITTRPNQKPRMTAEVRMLLKTRDSAFRTAAGPDNIPGRVLRECADQLADVLTDIFSISLSCTVVPACFKTSTIVPVPKKPTVSCLNDYCPIALTSIIMKCFERLVMRHIKTQLSPSLDPLQFAYHSNRSIDDAISTTLHLALTHLDKKGTYVRMLFIDFSSAFNTIVPQCLIGKLGLNTSLGNWILDFLTGRPQSVRIGSSTSNTTTLSAGAPQGSILSPLLFTLLTHDCAAMHRSNHIIKFADDTTVVGLINKDDESAYREEVRELVSWCKVNNLHLNVDKTKEMVVDFRRARRDHSPLAINSSSVEIVKNTKFLGGHLAENLTWTLNISSITKRAQQQSILSSCIITWFGNCTAFGRKTLQRIVRTAEKIIGVSLPSITDIYTTCCIRKTTSIVGDPTDPSHKLFTLLPSGKSLDMSHKGELPRRVEDWTKEQVHHWLAKDLKVDHAWADRLYEEDVSGEELVCFNVEYIENYCLPPESGPSNLTDAVHEYKLLARAENTDAMKKKINKEVFRFAAGCMNSRTNGTIHFGVADSKNSTYSHGEIIGVSVEETDSIIDYFNQGIKSSFEENPEDAKRCIRQPRFVEVLSCNSTLSGKYVIEVDVVPYHSIVCGKMYRIRTFDEENQWKKSKGHSLFIREGAATRDVYKIGNPSELQAELVKLNTNLPLLDTMRKGAEMKPQIKQRSNDGEKLVNLLTCGGGTLDYYNYYIIVTNKSHPEQLQHLQFLTTLKLFCVLDFDPDSVKNGTCHEYRKVRIANLHTPGQFHGDPGTLTQNLNLYKQTSWILCNGRVDMNKGGDKPLPPSEWLKTKAGEVQDMISYLCNPDILPRGRFLVIFLLLSVVEAMNDPIFETFMSFYKNLRGTQNILSICTSVNAFQKWKDFIQTRTELDINGQNICELELSQINGSILGLGKRKKTTERLLPSDGGSSVLLKQIDEDSMPALDVLCQNQCENVYDEDSEEFQDFKKRTEAEFYRGDKVKWWNFYFSDKTPTKPFVKRDKYTQIKQLIRSQTKEPTSTCVMLNLFHQPGCGGTTLAMHVMWDLRREFRCAVLKDNTVPKTEVAQQVAQLLRFGKSEPSFKTPVLLLVEDSEETENTQELQHCLRKIIGELDALAIILNCIRSKTAKEKYKNCVIESQYITAALSKDEQKAFEVKLQELQEIHETPENFYSFMIMKNNFSKKYVKDVANNILRDVDVGSKQAQLLSILALLMTYVAESNISVSICEDFLGIKRRLWGKESLMDKMEPYSCLLIELQVEEHGVYKAIRFIHQRIAAECVEVLNERHCSPKSDIIQNMLHCDLFFDRGIGRDNLLQSLKSMLITRQRKTEGNEKDTLFSPLIEDINSEHNGAKKIQDILTQASKRFDKDFAVPQALARHYYLNEKNFALAKDWANKSKDIKENSYTVDTVGQVSRSEIRHRMDLKKQDKTPLMPEDLREFLELAQAAIQAFQTAQVLAKTDDIAEVEERRHWKQNTYNISGYISEIDITMTVFDIVKGLPMFEEKHSHAYFKQVFKGKMPLTSIPTDQSDAQEKLIAVLKDFEKFLTSLKPALDRDFRFLEEFFTYTREKGVVDREKQEKNRKWISDHFKSYISLFCSSEEKQSAKKCKPKLSSYMEIEECRMFLEEKRANNFPRILQFLESRNDMIEQITEKHSFIYKNSSTKSHQDLTNHLLAHIILKVIKPKSKQAKPQKEMTDLLKELLQEVGLQHQFPEPYYLALLLLWPRKSHSDQNKDITTYVERIRISCRKQFSHMFRARTPIVHFYLGKSDGLDRLVSKAALDGFFSKVRERNVLWQSADIFKEQQIKDKLLRINGTIEQGELYAEYGNLRIPVRPAYLGGIRSGHSTEKVSFYVGFAIDGPLAYDIQYEDS